MRVLSFDLPDIKNTQNLGRVNVLATAIESYAKHNGHTKILTLSGNIYYVKETEYEIKKMLDNPFA